MLAMTAAACDSERGDEFSCKLIWREVAGALSAVPCKPEAKIRIIGKLDKRRCVTLNISGLAEKPVVPMRNNFARPSCGGRHDRDTGSHGLHHYLAKGLRLNRGMHGDVNPAIDLSHVMHV